jgi:hypothetical protein
MDDFLENQLGFLEFPIETAQTISAIDVTMTLKKKEKFECRHNSRCNSHRNMCCHCVRILVEIGVKQQTNLFRANHMEIIRLTKKINF